MFVSSVDSADPAKNAIFQIAPDGTFMGAFVDLNDMSLNAAKTTFQPTAILIPPVQDQTYLRGLISGTGTGAETNLGLLGGATDNSSHRSARRRRPSPRSTSTPPRTSQARRSRPRTWPMASSRPA